MLFRVYTAETLRDTPLPLLLHHIHCASRPIVIVSVTTECSLCALLLRFSLIINLTISLKERSELYLSAQVPKTTRHLPG